LTYVALQAYTYRHKLRLHLLPYGFQQRGTRRVQHFKPAAAPLDVPDRVVATFISLAGVTVVAVALSDLHSRLGRLHRLVDAPPLIGLLRTAGQPTDRVRRQLVPLLAGAFPAPPAGVWAERGHGLPAGNPWT
jgi:hypothetical protein